MQELGKLPPCLCGQDSDQFTSNSIHVRLPNILEETSLCNPQWSDASRGHVLALAEELRTDGEILPLSALQSEVEWEADGAWYCWVGKRYSEVPWFFLENYVYKRLLEAVVGEPNLDPFQMQKDAALAAAQIGFVQTVLPLSEVVAGMESGGSVRSAILRSLWGNRADLSLSAGKVDASHGQVDAVLLSDDLDKALDLLSPSSTSTKDCGSCAMPDVRAGNINIILDNCGLELLSDLVLVDVLLRNGCAGTVTLHCKTAPVFVSDAMVKDIHAHIAWIEGLSVEGGSSLAGRLRAYLGRGTLMIRPHTFYTSPYPYWDAPADLVLEYRSAILTIVKGDANYRRLLGDRHWPHDKPFADVLAYFPGPVLALRTCKAGLAVGITPVAEAMAIAADPVTWLVSGKYGLIQLKA